MATVRTIPDVTRPDRSICLPTHTPSHTGILNNLRRTQLSPCSMARRLPARMAVLPTSSRITLAHMSDLNPTRALMASLPLTVLCLALL